MAKVIQPDSFKAAVQELSSGLSESWKGGRVKTLSNAELKVFKDHNFIRGWLLEDIANDIGFKILLSSAFPYDIPRVGILKLSDRNYSFECELPHVEGANLLCLPFFDADFKFPTEMALYQLQASIDFYNLYTKDAEKSENDFKAEFLSYWTRASTGKRSPVLSLLELSGEARKVVFAVTPEDRCLVAENASQAKDWLNALYPQFQNTVPFFDAYIFPLNTPPVPMFPSNLTELETFLTQYSPESLDLYRESLRKSKQQLYIFTASGDEAGTGVVCVTTRLNGRKIDLQKGGFRDVKNVPFNILRDRINNSINFERRIVSRVDHTWVHGRGDEKMTSYFNAKVTLLGCGSLGSHVAVRLAQMGVGSIYLVDPQSLESANTSRHALGAFSLGKSKAEMLARDLKARFPHLSIEYENVHWQALSEKSIDFLNESDLVVSTIAEWSGEGQLNELWMKSDSLPPILYGWIEARAAAAHAVLMINKDSCLGCVRNAKGIMYEPETSGWPDLDGVQSEPACGTLYQPYGAVDLAQGEILVANAVSDFLNKKFVSNTHLVQTVSSERLIELGGEWSVQHLAHRPKNYEGTLSYQRDFTLNSNCVLHKT